MQKLKQIYEGKAKRSMRRTIRNSTSWTTRMTPPPSTG